MQRKQMTRIHKKSKQNNQNNEKNKNKNKNNNNKEMSDKNMKKGK